MEVWVGISILKNLGPKFDIELESAGKIKTQIESEFKSVNVNQSIHRIYLKLNTQIGILTPLGSFGKTLDSEVLLTEAIIVGKVPDTYYDLDGLNNSDVMEVIE